MNIPARVLTISSVIVFLILGFLDTVFSADKVTIDYEMSVRAIDWLEYMRHESDEVRIEEYFMENVAPTEGCESIIEHWARFMEWDDDKFYSFIMQALDRVPNNKPTRDENGELTVFGRRRELWMSALENSETTRENVEKLRNINLADTCLKLAKRYLPESTEIEVTFYIVLFGGSSAYSVGDVNGFDLLQLPKDDQGNIDIDEVIATFAHEIHHSGFARCNPGSTDHEYLVALLAAEGMPTYFVDKTGTRIDNYSAKGEGLRSLIAKDWLKHEARLHELYLKAESDIEANLEAEDKKKVIFEDWMSGVKGPAYVLGYDMFSVIDKYLGVDSAVAVAEDFRRLIDIYNEAALIANQNGEQKHIFDEQLAQRIREYQEH